MKLFLLYWLLTLFLFILIVFGNLFARFGFVTPGLLILIIQGLLIGWVAGNNAFEFPGKFSSKEWAEVKKIKDKTQVPGD